MKTLKFAVISLAVFILSGCSILKPMKTPIVTKYVINALPSSVMKKRRRGIVILVLAPITKSLYNTSSMIYSMQPYQTAAYLVNQWARTPSQMLQPLIVRTLQKTRHFHAVVTPPFNGVYQYVLSTQIYQLLQDYTREPGVLRLTVQAQIIRVSNERIVASTVFTLRVPILVSSPYDGVVAANRATRSFLQKLARFTLSRI